jgi:hypothetical protein
MIFANIGVPFTNIRHSFSLASISKDYKKGRDESV